MANDPRLNCACDVVWIAQWAFLVISVGRVRGYPFTPPLWVAAE
jgi:hypothetical protein